MESESGVQQKFNRDSLLDKAKWRRRKQFGKLALNGQKDGLLSVLFLATYKVNINRSNINQYQYQYKYK